VVSFHFVYRGIRDGRPRDSLHGGIVAGLALYSYAAAQVALFAALGLLLLRALQTRTHGADRQLLGFLAGAAVAALPLFASWALAPELPGVRVRELAAIAGQDQGALGVLMLLGSNLGRHLWMFHGAGDPNPRHNLSGEPMLDLVTGVLFAVGTLLAIREFRRAESQLCLVWLGAGLMAGVLSSHPAESPHAYRTGFVAPVCCLLAARGAAALWGRTRGRFPPGALWAGVILLLAATTTATAWDYFQLRPGAPESWGSAREGVAARLIRERVARAHARNERVTVEAQLRTASLELELFLLRERRRSDPAPPIWTDFAGSWERVEQTLDSGVRGVVVMRPELRDEALRRLPQHGHDTLLDPFDSVVAITVESRP
jgi:4-amino-4-deoxy-L-arabinose transferase-like glycosyltransferase